MADNRRVIMKNPDSPTGPEIEDAGQDPTDLAASVEALLFATEKPLTPQKLSELGELGGVRNVRRAVEALNQRYEQSGCTFRIVEIAGGYQLQTLPEYNDLIARLHKSRQDSHLSQASLETLAVVAYRQPVLRADVEAIRGVACGEVLRGLMEKGLIRIAGRAEEIGRPLLYGTTQRFLEVFGLAGLDDLPKAEQLRVPVAAPTPAGEEAEGEQDAEDGPQEATKSQPADSEETPETAT
jgi:segregation and condensation protein B